MLLEFSLESRNGPSIPHLWKVVNTYFQHLVSPSASQTAPRSTYKGFSIAIQIIRPLTQTSIVEQPQHLNKHFSKETEKLTGRKEKKTI